MKMLGAQKILQFTRQASPQTIVPQSATFIQNA